MKEFTDTRKKGKKVTGSLRMSPWQTIVYPLDSKTLKKAVGLSWMENPFGGRHSGKTALRLPEGWRVVTTEHVSGRNGPRLSYRGFSSGPYLTDADVLKLYRDTAGSSPSGQPVQFPMVQFGGVPHDIGKTSTDAPIRRTAGKRVFQSGHVDARMTEWLRGQKLKARSGGHIQDAVLQAGFYAVKTGTTMYLYRGNSYMTVVWRVTHKASEYLNPINNTGTVMYSVTPELEVLKHEDLFIDKVARRYLFAGTRREPVVTGLKNITPSSSRGTSTNPNFRKTVTYVVEGSGLDAPTGSLQEKGVRRIIEQWLTAHGHHPLDESSHGFDRRHYLAHNHRGWYWIEESSYWGG